MLPPCLRAAHSRGAQGQAGLLLQHWSGGCCASGSCVSLAKERAGRHSLSSGRGLCLQCAGLLLGGLHLLTSVSWVQKKNQTEEPCGIVRTLGGSSRWKRGLTEAQSSQLPPSAPQTEWVRCLAAHASLLLAASIADSILPALGREKVFSPHRCEDGRAASCAIPPKPDLC